ECKMVQPLWKTGWQFILKLNTLLPYDLAVTLLGIYLDLKTYVHTKTCIWMLTAVLFIIAKTWKTPRCSSVDESINKLVYPENGIVFSAEKEMNYQAMKIYWRTL
ncbi:LORF2 protein, partial [Crocuta crocuta]